MVFKKPYPLQYSYLENSMDGGAWWATVHGVTKSWKRLSDFTTTTFTTMVQWSYLHITTSKVKGRDSENRKSPHASLVAQTVKNLPAVQETQVQSLGREDPLEKRMATHSSILAWSMPWIEEPGGLQPMGSQRIGHDWATNTFFLYRI